MNQLSFLYKSDGCQNIDVFYKSNISSTHGSLESVRLSVYDSIEYELYTIQIPSSTQHLRIDPCDLTLSSTLKDITIKTREKSTILESTNANEWVCSGCSFSIDDENHEFTIIAQNSDPMFYTNSFTRYSNRSVIEQNILMMKASVLKLIGLMVSLLCLFVLFNLRRNFKQFSYILLISITFVLILLLAFNFNKFKNWLPVSEPGSDQLYGYVQYFKYPSSSETILIYGGLLIPLLISVLLLFYKPTRQ